MTETDPYINPQTGRRWKLTQTERDFIQADKVTSQTLLALQFNVHPRLIDFIQNPDRYHANNEYIKAYRKRRRRENPVVRKYRKKKVKPPPLDPYEAQIHEAIAKGTGLYAINDKLAASLSQLVQNKLEIEAKIEEVKKAQNALYRYASPEAVLLCDSEVDIRKTEVIVYMEPKEMKWLMTECGLTVKKLVEVMKKRYSARALQSYRNGETPIPKSVADLLRGYPRKEHVEWV